MNKIVSDKYYPLGQNARRELYLWAIFVGRFELGKYLCSKTWVNFSEENVFFLLRNFIF